MCDSSVYNCSSLLVDQLGAWFALNVTGKVRRLVWGDSAGIIFGVINVLFILKCGINQYSLKWTMSSMT